MTYYHLVFWTGEELVSEDIDRPDSAALLDDFDQAGQTALRLYQQNLPPAEGARRTEAS